ncbi:hypothetical protein ACFVAJ_08290 [Agromyces sp. NPDC057679]|uniref:DUF7507 domain-containing protein n=1 Tax=Agromyces sp. NPDC057679 TaxID=3346207 RepID=UPI003671E9F1
MGGIRARARTTAGIAIIAGALLCGAAAGAVPAFAAASGPIVVDEDFRGATTIDGFQAYGSACLTGAPTVLATPVGLHPVLGCPAPGPAAPPNDAAPDGFLRLTDRLNDQAGAVLYDVPIPATQGVEITFEQWQYGSNTIAAADGIAFFLVDGETTLDAPGAFGGSLGYAQKEPGFEPNPPFLPGVEGGYLGIGLDVLGNFFGDWERRGDGCEVRSPSGEAFYNPAPGENMVTVRGPGDGTQGYCFLTATADQFTTTGPWTSTLPGELHGPAPDLTGATPAEAAALLEPTRRTVTVHISPAPDPQVTVSIDFNDGAGSVQVLEFAAPQPAPASYKFGFSASTGLFNDVHLIRNVVVQAVDPLVQLQLTKTVDDSRSYTPGEVADYTYDVANLSTIPVADLVIDDDRISGIVCDAQELAPAGEPGDTTVCRGSYTVTEADADAGSVTNVATATAQAPGGPVISPPATATITVIPGATPTPTPTPTPTAPATAPPAPPGAAGLPATGFPLAPALAGGIALLVIGAGLRRRRSRA